MIVHRLEFQFDDGAARQGIPQRVIKKFLKGVGDSRFERRFELTISAERHLAVGARDNGVICRVFGDDDTLVATQTASEGGGHIDAIFGHIKTS